MVYLGRRGRRTTLSLGVTTLVLALQSGCANSPGLAASPPARPVAGDENWSSLGLPGKRLTHYEHVERDGKRAILARADASASMYRQRLSIEPDRLGNIEFSWWVPALMAHADLTDRDAEDSPVRIVLAFDGDRSKLSGKNRLLFELAETLTGEPPPYATLMYVWDNRTALETVIPAGRTDRIRKIVVNSGPAGLKAWCRHRRDIALDFERAFGEPPGRLIGVALMTDSDNTHSQTQAWYGDLVLTSRDGAVRQLNE